MVNIEFVPSTALAGGVVGAALIRKIEPPGPELVKHFTDIVSPLFNCAKNRVRWKSCPIEEQYPWGTKAPFTINPKTKVVGAAESANPWQTR